MRLFRPNSSPLPRAAQHDRSCAHRRGVFRAAFAAALLVGVPPQLRAQGSAVVAGSPGDPADSLLAALIPLSLRATVLAASPELALRRAEVVAAEARRDARGFAPPVALGIETEDARDGRLDRGSTRIDVSRDFLSAARRRGERAVGEAEVEVARVALVASERRTLAEAARALYAAVGWRTIVRRLGAQDSLLTSAEASVRARFAVGEARYVDVLRLRTERLRVQSDRATAETEIETAAITLVGLAGGDSAASRVAAAALDSLDRGTVGSGALFIAARLPEAPSIESLVATAADVRLADARITQATAQRRLVAAQQRPALTASAGVKRMGPDSDVGAGFSPVLSVGVTLPFTAGRANRAAIAAADQQALVASASRRAVALSVRTALAAARARYEAARQRAAAFDATLLRAARDERESALAAYRTSDISLLDLLDFERALSRAEIERTHASLDALSALAELLSGAPSSAVTSTSTTETGAGRVADDH